ncbi:hypothetical protein BDV93DRAFT_565392 [Ceratobasidium sp. AG-I]|nr:hypothetical protein BDV93DRAFT_565392 [Ceratobasidium sp. AG-I]
MHPSKCPYCFKEFKGEHLLHLHYSQGVCAQHRGKEIRQLGENVYRDESTAPLRRALLVNRPSLEGERMGSTDKAVDYDEHGNGQPMLRNISGGDPRARERPQPTVNHDVRPEQVAGQLNPPKRHGYAAVEVHQGAARVIRWELENPRETSPKQFNNQKRLFCLGEWLSRQPISDQARAEYFDIERLEHNSLWTSVDGFHAMVDALERGPDWSEEVVNLRTPEGSESFVVHKRNPVDVVRHLIGLVRLHWHMRYGPERHTTVTINGETIRVYSEMGTGDWWWRIQELIGEGATIAPFILASDQTCLTAHSGSKVAWAVYASIGNIAKAIRRRPSEQAMLLIGLIPVAGLEWITDEEEQAKKRWEL